MRGTLRTWLFRTLSISEPISVVRITDCWLAIGLSRRIGFASPAKSASQRRLDEAEVDHFAVVARGEPLAQRVQAALRLRAPAACVAAARGGCAAMRSKPCSARHLLDQVFLDLDVEAVATAA